MFRWLVNIEQCVLRCIRSVVPNLFTLWDNGQCQVHLQFGFIWWAWSSQGPIQLVGRNGQAWSSCVAMARLDMDAQCGEGAGQATWVGAGPDPVWLHSGDLVWAWSSCMAMTQPRPSPATQHWLGPDLAAWGLEVWEWGRSASANCHCFAIAKFPDSWVTPQDVMILWAGGWASLY